MAPPSEPRAPSQLAAAAPLEQWSQVSIVGLGLIGGSLARALRRQLPQLRLVGIDKEETSAKLDLLDELLEEAIDGEHRVRVEIRAFTVEDVRGDGRVAVRAQDQVDVRRAPRVPARRGEHPADGPVVRDRVGDRPDRQERVAPVSAGGEPAAEVLLSGAPGSCTA